MLHNDTVTYASTHPVLVYITDTLILWRTHHSVRSEYNYIMVLHKSATFTNTIFVNDCQSPIDQIPGDETEQVTDGYGGVITKE